ncbi:MAG: flagellar brake domain-containing protein, partial [Treponema sp.]|nr:flagellar brake domain-containing protein [Treponema sp.]
MMGLFLALYPLQVAVTDFWSKGKSNTSNDFKIFLIFIGIVITVVIVIYLARKGPGGFGISGSKLFSGFAFRRLASNIGLSGEQIRMLDFIFKTDDVVDPEKSFSNPALLDRHFRRAYRVIEQKSNTDEEFQRKLAVLFSTRNVLEKSAIGALSNTRQIKDETVLILSHGREKIKVPVLSNKSDFLYVETPKTVLGSQIKIPKGEKIGVLFFTKSSKGFNFETRVTGYSTFHGHPVMQLAHSNSLKFLALRRHRRRQAGIACSYFLVYVEGSGKKQRLVVDKRRINGNIVDISVGGCSIKATTPVQVGVRFKIEFTQGENKMAALG